MPLTAICAKVFAVLVAIVASVFNRLRSEVVRVIIATRSVTDPTVPPLRETLAVEPDAALNSVTVDKTSEDGSMTVLKLKVRTPEFMLREKAVNRGRATFFV